ncbi:MAG: hypothetical protein ABI837_11450 [Acidobacteriota bacterium]
MPFPRLALATRWRMDLYAPTGMMSSSFSSIRRATTSDARAVASFAARTFAETFGPANRPEDLASHLALAYGEQQQRDELADPD